MNALPIADLPDSEELDREALARISGARGNRSSKRNEYVVFDLESALVSTYDFSFFMS
jgi:hypothetical protein